MTRTSIESSNIKSVGYDPDKKILETEFSNGGVYQYSDVPEDVYQGFIGADSPGKFLNGEIKGKFSFSQGKQDEAQ